MKHHLCLITSDKNVLSVVMNAFQPLGIEVDHIEPQTLVDGQLVRCAKVTVVDLEAFDSVPNSIWDNLRVSLGHTLCVPLIAQTSDTIYRRWFGTPLKTLTKPLTGAQLRWLVFQCVGRIKNTKSSNGRNGTAKSTVHGKAGSLASLASIFRHQHPEKFANQRRVVNLVEFISQRCRIDPSIAQAISTSASLYDIGTLLERPIENVVLNSKRRRRYFYSAAIAKFSNEALEVVQILRNLDENWDGSGFPAGKKGSEIPIGARMLRIAVDFIRLQYDSERALYLSTNESAAWLRDSASTLYDPELVKRFLDHFLENTADTLTETLWICGARNLLSGMTLSEDLYGREGLKLLSKGKVLNEHLVTRLIDYEERFSIRDGLFAAVQNNQQRNIQNAN
ncbi:hypothetical protein KUV78_12355 [Marinobacter hydrocarbonoclasticus]|uniref:HD-GYP domain-containing protein n=1 Tax=Marinobacter nauticus TaxID=2743 RepID=UPI001C96A04F|nr:HD domain-containing phosphohydrolase [Marinobacter nauticus]MBY6194582.1 hypothetical protein [Marinobacter nauticus]MBY6215730.1 hypothetical protein [Marinobacter nauticus]